MKGGTLSCRWAAAACAPRSYRCCRLPSGGPCPSGREVRADAGLRLEKNIFVPDSVHLTRQTLPLSSAGRAREGSA